jgi:hypothetical protein
MCMVAAVRNSYTPTSRSSTRSLPKTNIIISVVRSLFVDTRPFTLGDTVSWQKSFWRDDAAAQTAIIVHTCIAASPRLVYLTNMRQFWILYTLGRNGTLVQILASCPFPTDCWYMWHRWQ